MDTQEGLRTILTTAGFTTKAKNIIVEFLCKSLSELANIPSRKLDAGVINLHTALSNVATIAQRIGLNVTKCRLLHAICLHFLDWVKCATLLDQDEIDLYTIDDVNELRTHYQKLHQSNTLTVGMGDVTIPKLTPVKWQDFKPAVTECPSCTVGKYDSPLLYIIQNNEENDFDCSHNTRREQLVECSSLKGPTFKANNGDIFSLLL